MDPWLNWLNLNGKKRYIVATNYNGTWKPEIATDNIRVARMERNVTNNATVLHAIIVDTWGEKND